jgi:hypothetical protein
LTHLLHILLNCALADFYLKLEQFSPNALCAPVEVLLGHAPDQCDVFLSQRLSAPLVLWLGLAPPYATKQVTVPAQECIKLDDDQGLFPRTELAGQEHKQRAVVPGEFWSLGLPLQHDHLLAQEGG